LKDIAYLLPQRLAIVDHKIKVALAYAFSVQIVIA
jgi:hypothetical protein